MSDGTRYRDVGRVKGTIKRWCLRSSSLEAGQAHSKAEGKGIAAAWTQRRAYLRGGCGVAKRD